MPDVGSAGHRESHQIHPGIVIGSVTLETACCRAAASVRGDEGRYIHIGNDSRSRTESWFVAWRPSKATNELPENEVEVDGKPYSVYIEDRVSLAHQSWWSMGRVAGQNTLSGCRRWSFRAELHRVGRTGPKSSGVKVPRAVIRALAGCHNPGCR